MRIFPLVSVILFSAIVTGCGGSSSSEPDSPDVPDVTTPPQSDVFVNAIDTTAAVYENEPTVINLKNAIRTSDGSAPVLQGVMPISDDPQCGNIELGNLNFTLDAQNPGTCVYQYQAADASLQNTATAYTQVAVSGADAPLVTSNNLPTLSEAIEVGQEVVVQLQAPANMTLSTEVTVLGNGLVTDVDPSANTITYQAGTAESDAGITRIHYHYSDENELIRMGIIDVAVSTDTYNQAPVANDWRYLLADDFAQGKSFTALRENELVTVDLNAVLLADGSTGPLVNDLDAEDTLQLVDLHVFNATVELVDETAFDNLSFTFTSATAGRYYVTYQVSDHHGGFAIGIIEFNVQGTWPDVIVQSTGDVFKAPVSLEAATIADYDVTGVASEAPLPDGNGYENVPTYTWEAANAICRARGGSLPTLAQANAFLAQEQNPFIPDDGTADEMASNWPVARGYFTSHFSSSDPNEVMVYDGINKYLTPVSSGQDGVSEPYLGYLYCIDKTPQSLNIENTMLLKGVDQQLTASFDTASGLTFPYSKPLYWSVSEPEDSQLTAMEDIENNVTLNKYTGLFHAQTDGFVNIQAQTPMGDLSTSKDVEVIDNLLANGADPTFESFNVDSSQCEMTRIYGNDHMGFRPGDSSTRYQVAHGCEESGNGSYLPKSPQGGKYLYLDPNDTGLVYFETIVENTPLNFEAGQTYNLTFWFYWDEAGGGSNGGARSIVFKDSGNKTIHTCSILNGYSTVNPGGDLVFIEGNGAINTWTKAGCEFTPSSDAFGSHQEIRVFNKRLMIDDMVLLPVQ